MTKSYLLITLLGSLTLTSATLADTKADAKAPKPEAKPDMKPVADKLDAKKMASTPPEELATLTKFFVGTWHCEGKTTPPPGVGKTYNSKGNVTWAPTLDGFFLAGTSEGEKVAGQPLPTVGKGEARVTYDRTTKSFVNIGVGNRGGYGMSTSQGWEGDKLAWSGTTSGLMKTETRTTITKKGDTEYRVFGERMEAGKWVTGTDETCKKK